MAFPVGRALFSATCVGMLVYGILDYMTNFEHNKCLMTYMFEQPEYIKIPVIRGKKNLFPKYSLYIYGEGEYARFLEYGNYQGIPVLFIPGNSGSYKQARSLGSVAMRRQMDKRNPFLFNYFTVDFKEELSGIFGGVLKQQTEFVHLCIKRILKLYKENKPKSVILVGHSMGGMIARALFTLPDFDQSLVNTIITQATPHQDAVLPLDYYLSNFYNEVNGYWREYGRTNLSHVTVVSTGGGPRDILVRNDLTSLKGIVDEDHGLSTSTTAIPLAWVSTDHLCAVWCKQVVLATKRAMFDIVDLGSRQVSTDVKHRMSVFRHHFVSHPGTRKYIQKWESQITLEDKAHWVVQEDKLWEFAEARVMEPRYLVVPITGQDMDSFVAISNVMLNNWICVCTMNAGEKRCKVCDNISKLGQAIPPLDSGRKVIHLRLSEYRSATHIVLIVPTSHDKVEVMGEVYRRDERHLSYRLPGFSEMLMTYPESVTQGTGVLSLQNDTLFYNLHLLGLDTVLKAFIVQLVPQKCTANADLHDGSMMSLHIPWSSQDVYSFSSLTETGNLTVKLQSGISPYDDAGVIQMKIYVDPSCSYVLKIMVSPMQILGQLIRFYGPLLPGYLVAVVMMGIVYQLLKMGKDGFCPSLLESVGINGAPYRVVPLVIITSFLLSYVLSESSALRTDIHVLEKRGLMSIRILPLMMYSLSLGVINIHCCLLYYGVNMLSRFLGFIVSCCSSPFFQIGCRLQLPLLIVALILSAFICGPLGLVVCYGICVVKVLRCSYLASYIKEEDARSRSNYYLSVLMLLMPTVVINLPVLVSWAKQFSSNYFLESDPSRVVSVCGVLAIAAILIIDTPLAFQSYYIYFCWAVQVLTILMLMYSSILLYRIPYVTVSVLVGLALPQVHLKIQMIQTHNKKTL